MRVVFRVAVGMVHAVQHRVSAWIEKTGTLAEKGEQEEKLLPEIAHLKHAVRRIPMKEERLAKSAEKPVKEEKTDYYPSTGPEGNIEQHKLWLR